MEELAEASLFSEKNEKMGELVDLTSDEDAGMDVENSRGDLRYGGGGRDGLVPSRRLGEGIHRHGKREASPILILVVEDGGADGGGEGVERGSIGGVGLDIVFDLLTFSLVGLWSETWWNWDIRLPRLARRDLQTGWLREGLEVDRTWCLQRSSFYKLDSGNPSS